MIVVFTVLSLVLFSYLLFFFTYSFLNSVTSVLNKSKVVETVYGYVT